MKPPRSPEQRQIREAVILMAGAGSRLRGSNQSFLKPLIRVHERPLISFTLDALAKAGIAKIHAVVGFESERLIAAVKPLVPPAIKVDFVENVEWQKQNGVSLLAAEGHVAPPFLLTMSDHIFDQGIVDLMIETADANLLNLAVDTKLNSIFDLDDAMKVKTDGERIVSIGKNLPDYDAIDIGLFVCPGEIFGYAKQAKKNDDCSLADVVQRMAADKKVRAVDIGDSWWQDVDTPEMLSEAEQKLRLPVKS